MKSFILLCAIVCSVAGIPALNDNRIIDAGPEEVAVVGDFPYVVSITVNNRHVCGGFIYNNLWIVTAASCVSGKSSSSLKVIVGQVSFQTDETAEETISVFSVNIFEQYNSTSKANDIAMLKLTSEITFDDAKAVNYIGYNEVDPATEPATIMGWGVTTEGGETEALNLRSATVIIGETCATEPTPVYPGFTPASMICAGPDPEADPPAYPSKFDEGSPLVQGVVDSIPGSGVAVGVLSQTKGTNGPSVYTRLSAFYYWFNKLAGPQPAVPL